LDLQLGQSITSGIITGLWSYRFTMIRIMAARMIMPAITQAGPPLPWMALRVDLYQALRENGFMDLF